ncbi:Sec-independent protein translocase protein TatB [Roseovarius ramblicola]|uniref:Sec-independent protein translocase protein TatB n=1 Tax=Roseovarius ramblicola TaxID=2022336 RepID=A0ABV5I1A1_9RHOB
MFDLGWTELLVIGIVALIVVGPKDLPGMFQAIGRFVGKAKGMARDFSRAMNDAADQSGVGDIQKSFKAASNPMKTAMNEVKKTTDGITQDIDKATRPALDPERQAAADKIREKSAEMANARRAAEAEEEARAETQPAEPAKETATAAPATTDAPAGDSADNKTGEKAGDTKA